YMGKQAADGGAVDRFSQIVIVLLGVKPGDEFASVLVHALVGVQGAQIRTGRGGHTHLVDQLQRVGGQVHIGPRALQQVQFPADDRPSGALVWRQAVPRSEERRVGKEGTSR